MKRILALLVALLFLLGCACAEEASVPAPATLTAVGVSPVAATGLTAVMSFALSAEAETAAATNAAMEASRSVLMEMLAQQGVTADEVQFTRYDMEHVFDYHHTKMSETKLLKGFKLEAGLVTKLDDGQQARAIVDALFERGLGADYKLAFESASSVEAQDEALALAAQEAVRKASLLADAMGVALGELISVRESVADGNAQVEVTYALQGK